MSDEAYSTLSMERRGSVLEITFCRPQLQNRIDALAHRELVVAFRSLEEMKDVRAVVLAAEGRFFSVGGDLDFILAGNARLAARRQMVDEGARLLSALLDVAPPVVVAMQGDAIGVGATLVLASDAVVAHPGVKISDPHVPIGLVAGDGGCFVWPQAAGMLRAKRHLLTGDALDGADAHRLGLITDLVADRAEVLPTARSLAERLAALPPLAVQGTKRTLNEGLRHRFDEVMKIGLAYELISMGSDDLREAISAFREKRLPVYSGE
jgi:enoyl-CoA hydratase